MSDQEQNETPLGGYFGWFTVLLLLNVVVILLLRSFLNFSAVGIAMIAPFIASIISSYRFVGNEQRAPTEVERTQLTLGSLGISLFALGFMALAAVSGGALHAFAKQADVPVTTILIISFSITLCALVLNYLLIRWAYGSIARKRAEQSGQE